MKISGAIFDMDGTLTDSMFAWDNLGTRFLIANGCKPREGAQAEIDNMSMAQIVDYIKSEYGLTKTPQQITAEINALVYPIYKESVLLKPGVLALLEYFQRQGIKMCVATATDLFIAEMVLEKNQVLKYFTKIFTCTEVGAGKDRPTIYEKALENLGTEKSETLVFEDALYAVKTAKSAGFRVVGIFDECSRGVSDEIKALSDIYVTDYLIDLPLFT